MRPAQTKKLDSAKVIQWLEENDHGWGWLQEELGVHANTIRNYLERGIVPLPATLKRLSELMKVSRKSLLI